MTRRTEPTAMLVGDEHPFTTVVVRGTHNIPAARRAALSMLTRTGYIDEIRVDHRWCDPARARTGYGRRWPCLPNTYAGSEGYDWEWNDGYLPGRGATPHVTWDDP